MNKDDLKKETNLVKQEIEHEVQMLQDLAKDVKQKVSDRNIQLSEDLKHKFESWQQQTEQLKNQTENFLKNRFKR